MPYPRFDRSQLRLQPLSARRHDLAHSHLLDLAAVPPPPQAAEAAALDALAQRLIAARHTGAARILLMGAHVIRAGVARQLIDLMEHGWIDHVGMNGAGVIHDYELARIGATCESVARYIREGQFGLWNETGEINAIAQDAARQDRGLGEAVGRAILERGFPHAQTSVLAAGARLAIPITVHVGIGYDILHEHPNFDAAACGTTSYRDFLTLAYNVQRLEGGVLLCFGSAVMGPEVYLKALAMARNVAHQQGRQIRHFTTGVFDLLRLHGDLQHEAERGDPQYYYRPWKTILVRTVADGGQSYYIRGDHRNTLPQLRHCLLRAAATA